MLAHRHQDQGDFFRTDLTPAEVRRLELHQAALRLVAGFSRGVRETAREAGVPHSSLAKVAHQIADRVGLAWSLATPAFCAAAAESARHRKKKNPTRATAPGLEKKRKPTSNEPRSE